MIENTGAERTQVPPTFTLEDRPAAYSVIAELLRLQAEVAPRTALKRFFGVRPLHADAASWFSGAHGELKVGALLSRLGTEWTVLHAVPAGTGDSDIDHVAIGPAGVFTINTKRHRGQKIWVGNHVLMVGGHKTDHLRNSRHEAARAAERLTAAAGIPVDVHPIVAIVDAAPFTVKQSPSEVSVMDARSLRRWLKRRKALLDPETVQRISDAAMDSRIWHAAPDLTVDPTYLERFHALNREVNRARIARVLWALAVMIGIGFVAVVYVIPVLTSVLVAAITGA
ncbi:nuclease-like protein [Rhodoglobus vestalii]|uniref:Nuclease-like protein n=1 Tax=Rhodoglobus vestalii TaxID=193384 RepID=A0A8H2K5J7_9MICO|nr:nuclease-related domain-containing protein [Rhodoglobus vestalii]TQO20520.1 nuclease-like protein [Rhodoglobus vestalii]